MNQVRYDVFISLAGTDRLQARRIEDALRAAGLQVFVDEDDIRHFAGVTAQIEHALRSSKTLLAYYSEAFASREACQFELTAAMLAGYQEGNPTRRIMVINPEEGTEHIQPVELADDRFALLPAPGDAAGLADLVARIRRRIDSVSGAIGGVPFTRHPRWFAERVPGESNFVGRYREQWQLHTELRRVDFSLTQGATSAPIAALVGMSGSGKSAVAAAYAWQFGAAHPGGVYWLSLAGTAPTAQELSARFTEKIRRVAESLRLDVANANPNQIIAIFGDHIAAQPEPSLLVIDDVPVPRSPRIAPP